MFDDDNSESNIGQANPNIDVDLWMKQRTTLHHRSGDPWLRLNLFGVSAEKAYQRADLWLGILSIVEASATKALLWSDSDSGRWTVAEPQWWEDRSTTLARNGDSWLYRSSGNRQSEAPKSWESALMHAQLSSSACRWLMRFHKLVATPLIGRELYSGLYRWSATLSPLSYYVFLLTITISTNRLSVFSLKSIPLSETSISYDKIVHTWMLKHMLLIAPL